jgi:hypothetical protein
MNEMSLEMKTTNLKPKEREQKKKQAVSSPEVIKHVKELRERLNGGSSGPIKNEHIIAAALTGFKKNKSEQTELVQSALDQMNNEEKLTFAFGLEKTKDPKLTKDKFIAKCVFADATELINKLVDAHIENIRS